MIGAVANHLWQSTLFACVIGCFTLLCRHNRAAVRHALWLAASLKFILPFSLLIALGSRMAWQTAPLFHASRSEVVEQAGDSLAVFASPALSLPPESSSPVPVLLFSVWLAGFAASGLAYARRYWRVRTALRSSTMLPLDLPVPVLSSPSHLEPGVFGIVRPVLLLPESLMHELSPAQLDAILAHELCHVSRRDNLTFAIHMIVEATFWFYPPVRWIGARQIEERERACDEAVLRMGSDPETYATGIVAVCRMYMQSPLPCVSGVTGADLKRRVEAIMTNRVADSMSRAKKLLLYGGGAAAVIAPLIVGLFNASPSLAQQPPNAIPQLVKTSSLPEFEVASIRPSAPDSKLKVEFAAGGKLLITNATLRFLIKIAYDIGDDQLHGGPGWVGSKRFDLTAIPDRASATDPANLAPDQILVFHKPTRLRLQRLLAERFQLELRKESTPMPIFALVLANGGPRQMTLTKSAGNMQLNAKAGSGDLRATAMDMGSLAKFLSEGQVGRPVVDMTGLKEKYDLRLDWSPDTNQSALPPGSIPVPQSVDTGGISIFSALQQQLGLKLVPRTSPADRLVIARAEPPSEN